MLKIYTKTGDEGKTSLFTGQRIVKNDAFVEALGSVDECNSAIGVALSFLPSDNRFATVKEQLIAIQHGLFDIGAAIATPRSSENTHKLEKTSFDLEETAKLEQWIDAMNDTLTPLRSFILPSGQSCGAFIHLARSIARRAERRVTPLYINGDVAKSVMIYLNRLSDYLFILSRYVNHLLGSLETLWQPHKKN